MLTKMRVSIYADGVSLNSTDLTSTEVYYKYFEMCRVSKRCSI